MRISDWSSDVCSSDLALGRCASALAEQRAKRLTLRVNLQRTRRARLWRAQVEIGRDHQRRGARYRKLIRPVAIEKAAAAARGQRQRNCWNDQCKLTRQSVGQGKGVTVRVDLGGRRTL